MLNLPPIRSTNCALSADGLRDLIRFSLQSFERYSEEAEEILLMIAAHESRMGRYLEQIGGPAKGIYQMEPETERDIWRNYLAYRPAVAMMIASICGVTGPDALHLQYNHIYSTIMARLKLWMSPGKLPNAIDIDGMAGYCKDHYNSPAGKATVAKYIDAYFRYVLV